MKRISERTLRLMALIIAVVMIVTLVIPLNVQAQTNESGTQTAVIAANKATPGDASGVKKKADGLYKKNGYYYYYKNNKVLKRTGWVKIDKSNYIKLDSGSRVIYRLKVAANKYTVTKYNRSSGKFIALSKSLIVLPGKNLYYVGSKGIVNRKSGLYGDGKGNTYVASRNGVITAKLVKKGDKRKYYSYISASGKWKLVKNKYITLNNVRYYFRSGDGLAVSMYSIKSKKFYKYSKGQMLPVRSSVTTVKGKALYLFGKNGVQVRKSGWYKLPNGTQVYVGAKGYVTSKITKVSGSFRYYTFNYKTNKWIAYKNVWKNYGGIQYYFASNGIAKYAYNTKTGRLTQYSNGKFKAVKKNLATLSNGRVYFYSASGKKVSKTGWYDISSSVKIKVGAKGYVTNKFDSKAGRLYKYDYGKKKWTLLKMSTYKIGKNTYCFDSKGRLIRKQIAGNAGTGYYYVDSTGCKVTSKEIQTAVNLVIKNTNSAMTREQKLYACFMRIRQYPYARDYVTITADASQFSGLALQAMNSGTANCYKYASAFACVATVLGYDARVICGQMPAYYGSGLTDHGWTELWDSSSKSWKLYDSCLQRAIYYNWNIADYFPGESPVDKTAQLTVANGKVTWKWVK